jgi:hypothetical protein
VAIVGGSVDVESTGQAAGLSLGGGALMFKDATLSVAGPTAAGAEVLSGELTMLRSRVLLHEARQLGAAVTCGPTGTGSSGSPTVKVYESILWSGDGGTTSQPALVVGPACTAHVVGSWLFANGTGAPLVQVSGDVNSPVTSIVNTVIEGPASGVVLALQRTTDASVPRTRMAGVVVDSDAITVTLDGLPVVTTWSDFEQCAWGSCVRHEPIVSTPEPDLWWQGVAAGGPCVDFGVDPALLGYSGRTSDIDQQPRPVDGDGDSVPEFDVGPFELQP